MLFELGFFGENRVTGEGTLDVHRAEADHPGLDPFVRVVSRTVVRPVEVHV